MKNWEKKKLSELCDLITKGTTPTSIGFKFTDEGINFIKVESLTEAGEIIPNKVAYIDEECHNALKRSQLKTNDILFSIAGALGRIGIVRDEIVPANTNQALAIIRLKNNSGVLVNYLAKYFNSNLITDEIEKLRGGAAQQNLSLTQLNELQIPLPPLPEQQRIVAILDEAFAAIAKAKTNSEQNLKNAKELFESYMQGVFENGNWEEKTLGDVAKHSLGKMLDKNKNKGILQKYLRNQSVRWFEFDLSDLTEMPFLESEKEKFTAIKGDVLICEGGYPGRAAIWQEDYPIYFQKAIHRVRFHKAEYNEWFLYYLFLLDKTDKLKEHFTGTGIQHFTGQALNKLTIPIPPLNKVVTIVRKLDDLSIETKKLEAIYKQKINNLEELKKSVLEKAFSGQLKTNAVTV